MRLRLPRWAAVTAALTVLAGAGTWTAVASDDPPPVHRADRTLDVDGVRLDTSYFTGDGDGRRPAVLLGHGFGGSKDDVRAQAEGLAREGYAVLTWSARGFGASTGEIGLNDPDHEVKDVSGLIDWLADRPEVLLDKAGDPRVGVSGASYGGAISLLAAGHDPRVDAIAPRITYWNLADALFPDGVFKKLWAGIFFSAGNGAGAGSRPGAGDGPVGGETPAVGGAAAAAAPGKAPACGRFTAELCSLYQRVAVSGKPDAAARALLEARSPSAVGSGIKVPALLVQGQSDSLFTLAQSDAMARTLAANGAPVAVDWTAGGHDGGDQETERVERRVGAWFDRWLKRDASVDTGPAFRVSRTGGVDSTNGRATTRAATADRYPGLAAGTTDVPLAGAPRTFANPPGGAPPAVSAVPGLGGGLSGLSSLGVGLSLDFPGQHARFDAKPQAETLRITGAPTVRVKVTSTAADGSAVLFAKVYDVGPDGGQQVLPAQLVAPVRVEDARSGRDVTLTLPAIDHEVVAGHRLRLVVAATDLGYASPAAPAAYTVAVEGPLTVPTAPGLTTQAAALPRWVWGLPLIGLAVAAVLLLTARRRTAAPAPDPELVSVPLLITGLSKKYKGGERYSVKDLSFRVEQGQVLGLLGPNGAGKTTTLRMLMGLIAPDEGEIRVFGQAIRPGAPVLSRVGAFVEGAGFLPHLSGRENLDLYWRATGRPAEDAHVDEALRIANLGGALERAVRTYSQGMRQRLALAQAMLGLPDLLILDEPTNGLDPPQIREMREVMIRYAAGGRTVIVSSHLLAEVEQSCTHLVVMDRGQLVQAGPVAEITGSGDTLLVTLAERTPDGAPLPVLPDALVEKIGALPGVGSAARTDAGLLVRLDGADATALIAELVRLDVPLTGVGPHRRLEDAFLTLIGGGAA
ncbi:MULTISPECIES: CocE/NonD family hydrolase [unclassified Streptomyces]|uniref:CocE/NonD family hydrolase n=1 Tax=unclassified Streptomyces TaxID=2593676 RepID=UPI0006AF0473|nr:MULTISPECIES: CocE/NonD family hydrolase [unclassified Streptomyces]KOX37225.1 ABC transporter ATP-binding protein [Streptomyces sp. NRRL F-6491]KOX40986.1 ABC transporter ATP-binding protein [Streptomyces sp. NRRL F-6492]